MEPAYTERLDRALAFTSAAFRHERRKVSGVPYLTHLLAVMVLVAEAGGSENQMIAALLHDYLEDIEGATLATLEHDFGAEVAAMVEALSDAHGHPKPPWQARKQGMIDRMKNASSEVKLVCAADKVHNVRSILADGRTLGPAVFSRFSVPREKTVWYYRNVAEAIGEGFSHPLVDELFAAVAELEAFS